VSLLKLKIPFN